MSAPSDTATTGSQHEDICISYEFNDWTQCCGNSRANLCQLESIPYFVILVVLIIYFRISSLS